MEDGLKKMKKNEDDLKKRRTKMKTTQKMKHKDDLKK